MKKLLIIKLIILFFLNSCGFTPMYAGKKKINFYIQEINFNGDYDLASYIESNLNIYSKDNGNIGLNIKTNIEYQKNIKRKNLKGEAEEYELITNVNFNILFENKTLELNFNEIFEMNNFNDEFEEREFELNIKKNMANIITNKFIIQLSRLLNDS